MNHEYLWYWQDHLGIWHLTTSEGEAEVALHLGYYVVGERIPDDQVADLLETAEEKTCNG